MNGIQTAKRGRPKKLKDSELSRFMSEHISKGKTSKGDAEIAEDIQEKHKVSVSPDMIFRWRKKYGIVSCYGHGGRRDKAGRPKKDDPHPPKRIYNKYKLNICDYSLVRACPSAYNFKPGKWNGDAGKYEKLSRYVPKIHQAGIRSYTPILQDPDRRR